MKKNWIQAASLIGAATQTLALTPAFATDWLMVEESQSDVCAPAAPAAPVDTDDLDFGRPATLDRSQMGLNQIFDATRLRQAFEDARISVAPRRFSEISGTWHLVATSPVGNAATISSLAPEIMRTPTVDLNGIKASDQTFGFEFVFSRTQRTSVVGEPVSTLNVVTINNHGHDIHDQLNHPFQNTPEGIRFIDNHYRPDGTLELTSGHETTCRLLRCQPTRMICMQRITEESIGATPEMAPWRTILNQPYTYVAYQSVQPRSPLVRESVTPTQPETPTSAAVTPQVTPISPAPSTPAARPAARPRPRAPRPR